MSKLILSAQTANLKVVGEENVMEKSGISPDYWNKLKEKAKLRLENCEYYRAKLQELEQKYEQMREQIEKTFLIEYADQLKQLRSKENLSENNDYALGVMEYLLDNKWDITQTFRTEYILGQVNPIKFEASYMEIINLIFANFGTELNKLFPLHIQSMYPENFFLAMKRDFDDQAKIDIGSKESIDRFWGHLIWSLSGLQIEEIEEKEVEMDKIRNIIPFTPKIDDTLPVINWKRQPELAANLNILAIQSFFRSKLNQTTDNMSKSNEELERKKLETVFAEVLICLFSGRENLRKIQTEGVRVENLPPVSWLDIFRKVTGKPNRSNYMANLKRIEVVREEEVCQKIYELLFFYFNLSNNSNDKLAMEMAYLLGEEIKEALKSFDYQDLLQGQVIAGIKL